MNTLQRSCLALLLVATAAWALPLDSVPRPKSGTWVSDPGGRLSPDTVAQVDAYATDADRSGDGQIGVAVIDRTDGQVPRAYGTALFNRWGVGHAGDNDGVLLLIAVDDRKAEIILGSGRDTPDDEHETDRIMRDDVVANMRSGDLNRAVTQASLSLRRFLVHARGRALASSADPAQAARGREMLKADMVDTTEPEGSPWPFWIGVLALVGGGTLVGRHFRRGRPRVCKSCQSQRLLLAGDEARRQLDSAQQSELSGGTANFDVWYCTRCHDALVLRYAVFTSSSSDSSSDSSSSDFGGGSSDGGGSSGSW